MVSIEHEDSRSDTKCNNNNKFKKEYLGSPHDNPDLFSGNGWYDL